MALLPTDCSYSFQCQFRNYIESTRATKSMLVEYPPLTIVELILVRTSIWYLCLCALLLNLAFPDIVPSFVDLISRVVLQPLNSLYDLKLSFVEYIILIPVELHLLFILWEHKLLRNFIKVIECQSTFILRRQYYL